MYLGSLLLRTSLGLILRSFTRKGGCVVLKRLIRWSYWLETSETRYEIARLFLLPGPRPYNLQVAILVDDMIDTGRTLSLAVRTLHENGAKAIYALISHGLLSEFKMSVLETLPLERLVVRIPRRDVCFFSTPNARFR